MRRFEAIKKIAEILINELIICNLGIPSKVSPACNLLNLSLGAFTLVAIARKSSLSKLLTWELVSFHVASFGAIKAPFINDNRQKNYI